ncbi:hypothetical protein ABEI56_05650 [Peribacillus castrilensis]|uniref:hypothetical protein n=1 Tax=Peribacillus castrilensis TaxID=2897690 RepID=UPI003D28CB7B
MFNFWNMVDRYGSELQLLNQASGTWADNGDWIEGIDTTPTTFIGALAPLSVDDLQYAEEGTYSEKDRRLYTTEKLYKEQRFVQKEIPYTIQAEIPYGDELTDTRIYIARWAGNESRQDQVANSAT